MFSGNCDLVGHCFARKTLPSWSLLSQTAFDAQETEYKLPLNSRWIGEARGHTREQLQSQAMRLRRWSVALFASLLFPVTPGHASLRRELHARSSQGQGAGHGRLSGRCHPAQEGNKAARQQAREDLDKVLPAKIRQIRGGQ